MVVAELEARFVDGNRAENRGFRDLHLIIPDRPLRLLCREVKAAYPAYIRGLGVVIPQYECVAGVNGVIDTGADLPKHVWRGDSSVVRDLIEIVIENLAHHERVLIDLAPVEINEK